MYPLEHTVVQFTSVADVFFKSLDNPYLSHTTIAHPTHFSTTIVSVITSLRRYPQADRKDSITVQT